VEALLAAAVAAAFATLLFAFGPAGSDLAAHVYQTFFLRHHGFALWNDYWYAGRYSFVTYSLLYYPLAWLIGVKPLAVLSIAAAAFAFAVVVGREWGPIARWSSRTFAVVWAGMVLSGAFPFALGAAFALFSLWALQSGGRVRFGILATLTLLASPVAFLLLVVILAARVLGRRWTRGDTIVAVVLGALGLAEMLLFRLFPSHGRFPFSTAELGAAAAFCIVAGALTWRISPARTLWWMFVIYLAACVASYLLPSAIGENIARLRFAAAPVMVLVVSLRRWRPLPVCVAALALATAWNVSPLIGSYRKGRTDSSGSAAYWQPAVAYLQAHLTPSYRVEAVDTADHWPAAYLPEAGIPIVRGWFRQDDFPQNALLYHGPLTGSAYVKWLRSLGVRYVVLSDAGLDYSAKREAALLRTGDSGLGVAYRAPHATVYEVPDAQPLVTGPGPAPVQSLGADEVVVRLSRPGSYRVATTWSPYWRAPGACVEPNGDGMTRLVASRAGTIRLEFDVTAHAALAALLGRQPQRCDATARRDRALPTS
jgi:hypothetical protein